MARRGHHEHQRQHKEPSRNLPPSISHPTTPGVAPTDVHSSQSWADRGTWFLVQPQHRPPVAVGFMSSALYTIKPPNPQRKPKKPRHRGGPPNQEWQGSLKSPLPLVPKTWGTGTAWDTQCTCEARQGWQEASHPSRELRKALPPAQPHPQRLVCPSAPWPPPGAHGASVFRHFGALLRPPLPIVAQLRGWGYWNALHTPARLGRPPPSHATRGQPSPAGSPWLHVDDWLDFGGIPRLQLVRKCEKEAAFALTVAPSVSQATLSLMSQNPGLPSHASPDSSR